MSHTKICRNCGKEFTARDKRTKYCSVSCSAFARHNVYSEVRTCLLCGKEYIAKVQHQKYCSELCFSRSRSDYYANRYKKHRVIDCDCAYNVEVECFEHNCGNCGWNPEVAKARLEKYLEVGHEG